MRPAFFCIIAIAGAAYSVVNIPMDWIVGVVYLTVSLLGYTPEAAERSIDLSDAVLVLRGLLFWFAVFLAVVMIYRNKLTRYLMALGADITHARSVCLGSRMRNTRRINSNILCCY